MAPHSGPLRVGILASGPHPIQTIYLPALRTVSNLFTITAIHTAPDTTTASSSQMISDILTHKDISLILNFMPNEYHELYTIAALQAGKHVMVETPVSLSIPSAKRILDAERDAPNGAKVFVASARRYAPCFEEFFKKEVRALKRIHYARLRMIAGPRATHTTSIETNPGTSAGLDGHEDGHGNEPVEPSDHRHEFEEAEVSNKTARLKDLMEEVFGKNERPNQERVALSRFLASLGCHDLGLMRDTLGYPDAISKILVNEPFYTALFHYNGTHPFTLMYETGTDSVPRCNAHLAVYGEDKTVTIHYDLPYAQGQLMRVVVETADERGELRSTEAASTLEEACQEELKALHAYLVEGKEAKTTAKDSLQDIKLFQSIFEQYDRQCGTIRTPLG